MKIAQIAPLYESVPPKYYGGTERVVSYLVEELVRQEHEVTLFASGDSRTSGVLVPVCEQALRLQRRALADPLAHHVRMLELVFAQASEFDVLHFHLDYIHFPLIRRTKSLALTTLHGRLDIPDLQPLFTEFWEMRLCSVSHSQQKHLTHPNWLGTVHHGLPKELYQFHPEAKDYVVFLGRVCPEKGVDRAIEIAIRAGMPLKIAAKVDAVDQAYFEQRIRPLLDHPLVEFIGEIDDQQKNDLLGKARALLFPIFAISINTLNGSAMSLQQKSLATTAKPQYLHDKDADRAGIFRAFGSMQANMAKDEPGQDRPASAKWAR